MKTHKTENTTQGCNNPLGCACEMANGHALTDCDYWEGIN